MGRRKPHTLRESNDPYAEGWEARDKGIPRGKNPYLIEGADGTEGTKTERHKQMRDHNVSLWFVGWDAHLEDFSED